MTLTKNLFNKNDARYETATNAFLPTEVLIPVSGEVLVAAGDSVEEGQTVARDGDFCIHSSVPGRVFGVSAMPVATGKLAPCVRVRLEGKFSFFGRPLKWNDWTAADGERICAMLDENGVSDAFSPRVDFVPFSSRIRSAVESGAKNLFLRLYDADVSISVDGFLAERNFKEILEGAKIAAKAASVKNIFALYPAKSKRNFSAMADVSDEVKFLKMPVDSKPLSEKKEIIRFLAGAMQKDVEFSENDLAVDVQTALAVRDAVAFGKPMMERFVLVSGNAVRNPKIFNAKIGTPLLNLLADCGEMRIMPDVIVVNGILGGRCVESADVPVDANVKSISCLKNMLWSDASGEECVRCGNCRSICPEHLHPDIFWRAVWTGGAASCVDSAALCTSCRLCNAVCPARIPLCQIAELLSERGGGK